MTKTDWTVRVYGEHDKIIESWDIENRTDGEAFREAEADVIKISQAWEVTDWNITKRIYN